MWPLAGLIKDSYLGYRSIGEPVVDITFDEKGARTFAEITGNYAPGGKLNSDPDSHRSLAILMDGVLLSSPVIREPIHGGRAEISGSFDLKTARFLANLLSSGQLPCELVVTKEQQLNK